MARVLMVLTSHDMMGVSGKRTGNWFDEVATPYCAFKAAGFDVTAASPKGGAVPIDPLSFDDAFMTEMRASSSLTMRRNGFSRIPSSSTRST